MAEVGDSLTTPNTKPSQPSSEHLLSQHHLSSEDEFLESAQKTSCVAPLHLPPPPPPPPTPPSYPPPGSNIAALSTVPPPPPPPPLLSTFPLATSLPQPHIAQNEPALVLRDNITEEGSPKSSRGSTQSSSRNPSVEAQNFIEQTEAEPQSRISTPSKKKQLDIRTADSDINGQLLKAAVSFSDDGSLPPTVEASILPHIVLEPQKHATRNGMEQITQPPRPNVSVNSKGSTHLFEGSDLRNGVEQITRPLQSNVQSIDPARSHFKQNNEFAPETPPRQPSPSHSPSHIPAGSEVRKALNPPIPRSVLKKKGGQIFKRQRPTVPQTVEITADDLLQPHLTVPESTPESLPKKRVTFDEPTPEKPVIVVEPHRLTARQRKQLNDAVLARRQLNIFRNEAEIERRYFSSSRSVMNAHLNDLLSIGPTLLSKLSNDNLVTDFEEAWTKFRNSASIILEQNSTFERVVQKLTKIENSLISLDNRVREKDEVRLNQAAPITPGEGESNEDDALSDRSNDSPASAHSDSSGRTPSLVQEYYDKIGEVLLTKDYIHNLDTEHLQEVRTRKSQRDLGIELGKSDTQIYQEYFDERRELLIYYIRSKEAVYILENLCRDNEYRVEAPNLPPEGPDMDQSMRPSNSARVLLNPDYAPSEGSNTMGSVHIPDLHEPVRPSESRVIKWMKQINDELRPDKGWPIDTKYSLASETLDNIPSVPPGMVGIFDLDEAERTQKDERSKLEKDDSKFQPDKISRRYSDPNLRFKALNSFTKVRRRFKVRKAFSESP